MPLTKVTSGVRTLGTGEVTSANLAAGAVDTSGLEDDIALLGFRVASNGSLAKYNLVDQTVDDFQDASGVDASASTGEVRDASGKYYYGEATSSFKVHKFTADGTFTTDTAQDVEYLVVGGGGGGAGSTGQVGGGYRYGAGGGAGGYRTATGFAVTATSYSITVGDGGDGTTGSLQGNDGDDSVFSTITATGGGGGGDNGGAGKIGGSGGGGGPSGAGGAGNEGSFSPVEGYAGGAGGTATDSSAQGGAGGGGGASEVGEAGTDGVSGKGGDGGDGLANDIIENGTNVTYAGGGGGGKYGGGFAGAGGAGGGHAGTTNANVGAATANLGGGGGGAGNSQDPAYRGGDGGSGIVVIRRPDVGTATGGTITTDTAAAEGANMTLVSTTTAAQAAPTKGDIVLTYTNGAGTTTLDTDLTAEISADGGSTWTALALGSEGSTGAHNIATSHDVTISSTITAPYNMAYRIKTLNQSVSKTTRIQAVSLGWS